MSKYHAERYHQGLENALTEADERVGMVAIGLVVGLVLSYWATDLIQQLLFGVESTDPATFIMAALGFGVVALVACFLPAWRAMRVDPVTILQAE